MKTVKQWFEELPFGYRERALRAMTNPDCEVKNMTSAIMYGMIDWVNTKEGVDFWLNVYFYYTGNYDHLPTLPKY